MQSSVFFQQLELGKKKKYKTEMNACLVHNPEISCPLKQPEVKARVCRGPCTWVSSTFCCPLQGGCHASPFCPRAHLCHLTAAPSPTMVHFPSALGSKCPPESMPTWYLRTTPLGRGLHRHRCYTVGLWGWAGPHAVSGVLGRGSPDRRLCDAGAEIRVTCAQGALRTSRKAQESCSLRPQKESALPTP